MTHHHAVVEAATTGSPEPTPPEAFDGDPFLLTLGDLAVVVRSADRPWLSMARQRYGSFATAPEASAAVPDVVLDYRVRGEAVPSPDVLCRARRHGLRSTRDGEHIALRGDGFTGTWLPRTGRLQLSGPRATYPLDLVAQALWYEQRPGALIVHASAFSDGRRGWLCAGPSGSGKSTLAAMFPRRALADELVGLWVHGDGASADRFSSVDLVALPFWSGRPGRVPLAAVHRLRHFGSRGTTEGSDHQRRRLSPGEAFAGLRGQVSWPTWDPRAMAHCLDALGRLVEIVPVHELAFSPLPSVWPYLAVDGERRPA